MEIFRASAWNLRWCGFTSNVLKPVQGLLQRCLLPVGPGLAGDRVVRTSTPTSSLPAPSASTRHCGDRPTTSAADCDLNIGFCFCNGTYSHEYAKRGVPFMAQPGRHGRPVSWHFQPGKTLHTRDGRPHRLYAGVRPSALWGKDSGWCTSAQPARAPPCHLENLGGTHCDVPAESTCVNQCGGHGTCHLGFCRCDTNWCAPAPSAEHSILCSMHAPRSPFR